MPQERLPIPEEEEDCEETAEILSNREEIVTKNIEQIPAESEEHSEPLDKPCAQVNEQLQKVTESIANMKTEEQDPVAPKTQHQNGTQDDESKEEKTIIAPPPVSTATITTKDANNSTSDKGIAHK